MPPAPPPRRNPHPPRRSSGQPTQVPPPQQTTSNNQQTPPPAEESKKSKALKVVGIATLATLGAVALVTVLGVVSVQREIRELVVDPESRDNSLGFPLGDTPTYTPTPSPVPTPAATESVTAWAGAEWQRSAQAEQLAHFAAAMATDLSVGADLELVRHLRDTVAPQRATDAAAMTALLDGTPPQEATGGVRPAGTVSGSEIERFELFASSTNPDLPFNETLIGWYEKNAAEGLRDARAWQGSSDAQVADLADRILETRTQELAQLSVFASRQEAAASRSRGFVTAQTSVRAPSPTDVPVLPTAVGAARASGVEAGRLR